jgi:hypothetical protein
MVGTRNQKTLEHLETTSPNLSGSAADMEQCPTMDFNLDLRTFDPLDVVVRAVVAR